MARSILLAVIIAATFTLAPALAEYSIAAPSSETSPTSVTTTTAPSTPAPTTPAVSTNPATATTLTTPTTASQEVSHTETEATSDQTDSELLKSARQKRRGKDFAGALLDVNQAIEKSANDEKAYLERARLSFAQKKFAEAIADCTKSIELKENPRALNVRGAAKIDTKDYDGAIRDLNRSIEIAPGTIEAAAALSFRGRAKQLQGNNSDAIDDFNASVKINANAANPYGFKAFSELKLKQTDQAKIDLDKAIELNPKFTQAYLDRCYLKLVAKDYKGALDDANAAVRNSPKLPLAYSYRGKIRASLGDNDGALLDINQAIELGGSSEELKPIKDSILVIMKTDSIASKSEKKDAPHVDARVAVTPGQALETNDYMIGVQTQIKSLWTPSIQNASHKASVLRFMIDQDGKVFDIQTHTSSGDTKYDDSAKSAAAKVGTVKKPPAYLSKPVLIEMKFETNLKTRSEAQAADQLELKTAP